MSGSAINQRPATGSTPSSLPTGGRSHPPLPGRPSGESSVGAAGDARRPSIDQLKDRILELVDDTRDPDVDAPTINRLHGWIDPWLAHSELWEALHDLEREGKIEIHRLRDSQGWIVRWVRLKAPVERIDFDALRAETRRMRAARVA